MVAELLQSISDNYQKAKVYLNLRIIGDIVTEKSQSYSQNLQAEKIQNYYKWNIEARIYLSPNNWRYYYREVTESTSGEIQNYYKSNIEVYYFEEFTFGD